MFKEVYRHLFKSYGDLPLLWVGIVTEIIRTITQRIVIVIIISRIAVNVAAGDMAGAKVNIFLFAVVYIGGALLGTVGQLLAIHTTDKRYEALLQKYYQKLIGKDLSFYRDHQTGYLTSLFRQHLDGTMNLLRLLRSDVVHMLVSLIFPVVVLFAAGWKTGLIAAAVVLMQSTYVMWASSRVNKYRKPANEVYRKITGEVSDEITNAVAFKSGGHEAEAQSRMKELGREESVLFWLRHKMPVVLDMPRIIMIGLGISAAYYISVISATQSAESVGLFVLMFTYMFQIMRNSSDLPDLIARHDEHVATIYPTLEYLGDAHEKVLDPEHPKEFEPKNGSIEISDVGFRYNTKGNGAVVFKNLNLNISGGQKVGIVGLSGVGKSTLAALIMRFDDVDTGSIKIDGIDIRDVKQSSLRQKIAYVPQEPLLFHRSIRENISYFNKNASADDVLKASKAAHAHEFIEKLEAGYDSLVGERGIKLSGGQKQRVVIARAVLKNAPIMLFDEATSALDSESEQIIQNALPEIIGRHTAIIIAHRLSTIARLDRIVVMHDGAVVEDGTHTELIEKKGRYYSMWEKQRMNS